jgi:spore germination cell wall hydrolase CwlJ-like protein
MKILTEVLWVTFMTLMGAVFYGAYEMATMKPAVAAVVMPVNAVYIEPKQIDPMRFYREPKIEVSQREFDCLARNIFYEAGIEDYDGKIAVAQITWNRVQNGTWGRTICRVVYAPRQFSWTHMNKPEPHGRLWQASREAARDFLNGTRVVGLQKSKYYHATYIRAPGWTRNLEEVAVIGQHQFYQRPQ